MNQTLATRPGRRGTESPLGPPSDGWGGHLASFHRDPLRALVDGFETCGDVCRFRLGITPAFLFARPQAIQHVLIDQRAIYDRNLRPFSVLAGVIGEGLLTLDDHSWHRQREAIRPHFARDSLEAMVPKIHAALERVTTSWRETVHPERPIDLQRELTRLTLGIASTCLLGRDLSHQAPEIDRSLQILLQGFHDRMYRPHLALRWLPTIQNLALRREKKRIARLIYGATVGLEGAPPTGEANALTSLLAMSSGREQLEDSLLNLLIPALITTTNSLTFTFYLLGRHPRITRRLRQENQQNLGGRVPTLEDLPKLHLARRVIEESLRLYPPVWVLARRALADDCIDGCHVPRGSIILLSSFITQRHPELWPEPRRFDPDRFLEESTPNRHRLAHFPFGVGPRVCIGARFAMLQMQLILATLMQRFEISTDPTSELQLDARSTLSPRHGLKAYLRAISFHSATSREDRS